MKPIKGYEGSYSVTQDGEVFSHITNRYLSHVYVGKNYHAVSLSKNGKVKTFTIHRLVAEAFVPNPENYETVNHKDRNKDNNHYSNLEWCTNAFNKEHGSAKTVELISPSKEVVKVFNISKFCRDNGLSDGNINQVLSGKRKQHKGWRKVSEDC